MPYNEKHSTVAKMYNKKGKQVGLMVEGSMAYMESLNPDLKYGGDVIDQTAQKNEGSMATMDHGDSAAKFTCMSGGSSLHAHGPGGTHPDPEEKKQKESTLSDKDKFIDRKLNELAKTKPDMPPSERLKYAKNSWEMLPKKTK